MKRYAKRGMTNLMICDTLVIRDVVKKLWATDAMFFCGVVSIRKGGVLL